MTRSAENKSNSSLNSRSIVSYIRNLYRDNIILTLSVAVIAATYNTLKSKEYWDFIATYFSNFWTGAVSFFTQSFQYSLSSFALCISVFLLIKNLPIKSWREKVQYSQAEQTTFYTSRLLENGGNISTKEDFSNFCQDTVDSLHGIFSQKSKSVNTTWLIPENNKLILFRTNKNSKYKNEMDHFSFRLGEGVVGKSWASGEMELYSEKQENQYYSNRDQCSDVAYICLPIIQELANKYGVLSIGSDNDIYWSEQDKQTLRLISTVVVSILNNVPHEVKAELGL